MIHIGKRMSGPERVCNRLFHGKYRHSMETETRQEGCEHATHDVEWEHMHCTACHADWWRKKEYGW